MASDKPVWRKAFDGVERRVTPPLASRTSSADFQLTLIAIQRTLTAVERPVTDLVSWCLHRAGLPSHADVRALQRQLSDVQREILALRRDVLTQDNDQPRGR